MASPSIDLSKLSWKDAEHCRAVHPTETLAIILFALGGLATLPYAVTAKFPFDFVNPDTS